jgi:hypothetical protein
MTPSRVLEACAALAVDAGSGSGRSTTRRGCQPDVGMRGLAVVRWLGSSEEVPLREVGTGGAQDAASLCGIHVR